MKSSVNGNLYTLEGHFFFTRENPRLYPINDFFGSDRTSFITFALRAFYDGKYDENRIRC